MRFKPTDEEGLCSAAQCTASSALVVVVDERRLGFCDRHWEARCAEAERAWAEQRDARLAACADDPVEGDYVRQRYACREEER